MDSARAFRTSFGVAIDLPLIDAQLRHVTLGV